MLSSHRELFFKYIETYTCQSKYNDIIGVGTPQKYLNPCRLAHHVGVFFFKEVNRTGEITVAITFKVLLRDSVKAQR